MRGLDSTQRARKYNIIRAVDASCRYGLMISGSEIQLLLYDDGPLTFISTNAPRARAFERHNIAAASRARCLVVRRSACDTKQHAHTIRRFGGWVAKWRLFGGVARDGSGRGAPWVYCAHGERSIDSSLCGVTFRLRHLVVWPLCLRIMNSQPTLSYLSRRPTTPHHARIYRIPFHPRCVRLCRLGVCVCVCSCKTCHISVGWSQATMRLEVYTVSSHIHKGQSIVYFGVCLYDYMICDINIHLCVHNDLLVLHTLIQTLLMDCFF